MVILREKKEPDLHQALIILRPDNTSLRHLGHSSCHAATQHLNKSSGSYPNNISGQL